ncbi:nuclease NucT [Arcobacter acticola]|jgi:phosphatidylserine/phosphatidylglycerophosphate/cardiolipin synthase-like enzyme|uniref:phospholipase D n=1 Tax=Arcobacter acticola TaxID=1849015 RepID=A0A6M8EH77_9BACT|nr:phospholipase D-like domain-containing protein [Arcobacter acticola]QKE28756.1 nuclease NucT [Arcobacter acticola]
MFKSKFKVFFFIVFFTSTLFANEVNLNQNHVYFFPKQADEAKDKIVELIANSKDTIKISMYNFSYKKFAKELVEASKKGVKIQVILDEKKVEEDDEIYKYLKKNDIEIIISKKKLHTKIAIFDNKIALIGSLNWTKESFEENYESLLMSNNKEIIADIDNFFINFN